MMKKIKLNKSYIGAEIRGLRTKYNIDQEELSRKAEIDLYELKKIENGFKMPNLKEIVNIKHGLTSCTVVTNFVHTV